MKTLLTGASGFLGRSIKNITTFDFILLGRSNADILVDLSKDIPCLPQVDLLIHAAGKAHLVPKTIEERGDFFLVNVQGTINLLKGFEQNKSPRSLVFISSVAVYGKSQGPLISEDYPLLATDAYGVSKINAERIVLEWCIKHNVICGILRLPLIAGSNPPGNLGSMINGIKRGYYFNITNGKAKKSIVLAEDVARIIPKVAEIGGIYNLTDGYHPSFSELSELIAMQLGKNKPANIPKWLASYMAKAGDLLGPKAPITSDKLHKITSDLTFDDSKARRLLGWDPTPVLEGFKIH